MKVSWWSHPSPFSCLLRLWVNHEFGGVWFEGKNIPVGHLWQADSFPRLHSFDELFYSKSQSRDSFCLVTAKTCHWKWGVLSQTVFALFYRFTMAPSKGFRMPPFNHVHVLSETVRSRVLTNIRITDKAWNEFSVKRRKSVENGLKPILTFEEFQIFNINIQMYPVWRNTSNVNSSQFHDWNKLKFDEKPASGHIQKDTEVLWEILYSPLLIKPAHLLFTQLVALTLSRSIRQMLVIFSGTLYCIEIQENKKEVVFLCSRPPKKWNKEVSRCSRATTAKIYVQKSVMNVQSCFITKYKVTYWHPICFFVTYLFVRPFTLHATK